MVLGMGEDGHTASLFPGIDSEALDPDSDLDCFAFTPKTAPHERMTLTAAAILDSRNIVLHISGENKRQVYQQALTIESVEAMPVSLFLKESESIKVYWNP